MRRATGVLLACGALAIFLAGCGTTGVGGYGAGTQGATATTPARSGETIATRQVSVRGKMTTVLTDAQGKTLYYFTPDSDTQVACSGGCAKTWPPLLQSSGTPTSMAHLNGTLSTLDGPDGRQVLYNGHPLYRFAQDQQAGDAKGEGVGGKWFVATPDLALQGTSSGVSY